MFKGAITGCECEVDCSKKELADGRDGGWNWPDDGGNFWFNSDDHEGKKNPNAMDESENLEFSSVQIVRYYCLLNCYVKIIVFSKVW